MTDRLTPREERVLSDALARANAHGWGIALGALCGLGLFVATVILVVKGGPNPGPHLRLLAVYFPGYRITIVGGLVGLAYASAVGYVLGRTVAAIYNRLVL